MSGLILKDFFALKSALKSYFIIVAFIAVINFNNQAFIPVFLTVFLSMLPISAVSYDERANFDRFALTMPVSRVDLVVAKYMFGAICASLAAGISFCLSLFISDSSLLSKLVVALLTFLGGLLFQALILPIVFKLGSEKGRLYMFLIFMVPSLLVVMISNFGINTESLDNFIENVLSMPVPVLVAILVVFIALAYITSLLLSIKFRKNKEY